MDSSRTRRTSSRQDTTSRPSRDASSRRSFDVTRQLLRNDTTGQGGSSSGYDRAYTTRDVARSDVPGGKGSNRRSDAGTWAREQIGPELTRLCQEYDSLRYSSNSEGITKKHRDARSEYNRYLKQYHRNMAQGEPSQQLREESLLRNQQDDMGVSEHLEAHDSGQGGSSSGYDRLHRPTTGQLRLTERETKRQEEQREWLNEHYKSLGYGPDGY